MQYEVTTKPLNYPVTLDEVKEWLKVDVTDDDMVISGLIASATDEVQEGLGRAFLTQTIKVVFCNWNMVLPMGNVQAISSVKYYDTSNTKQTWSSSNYFVDTTALPHRVEKPVNVSFPSLYNREYPVEVIYTAGYGDNLDTIPYADKLIILVKVAELYDRRYNRAEEKTTVVDNMIRKRREWGF